MKSKKKKIDPETKNNPDQGLFFVPAPSIFNPETAFTAPALFSQDGVVMPNGRIPVLTRSFEVQVAMPKLLLHSQSVGDVSGPGRCV